MAIEPYDSRAFVGIELSGKLTDQLNKVQRAAYSRARSENRTLTSIPRRLMTVPLFDLGERSRESLEAAQLALDRATAGQAPFRLELDHVTAEPNPSHPALLTAQIADPSGALTSLRARIKQELLRFDFPMPEGTFQPLVPLTRVSGDGPPVDLNGIEVTGHIEVDQITIYTVLPKGSTLSMQPFKRTPFRTAKDRSPDTEEQAIRAALDAELQKRVAERWKSFSPKRIKKATEVDDGKDQTEPPKDDPSLNHAD